MDYKAIIKSTTTYSKKWQWVVKHLKCSKCGKAYDVNRPDYDNSEFVCWTCYKEASK